MIPRASVPEKMCYIDVKSDVRFKIPGYNVGPYIQNHYNAERVKIISLAQRQNILFCRPLSDQITWGSMILALARSQ